MLPTFLMIGSARCASTWLHEVLRLHPQIQMTQIKEMTYFGKECLQHDFEWYKSAFRPPEGSPAARVRGDVSTWYVRLSPRSVRAVHALVPDARIILMVRNPIERAWSNEVLQLSREVKDLSKVSIATFLRRFELTRRKTYNDYSKIIGTWSTVFPRESIHVELYDRVGIDPAGVIRDILVHIGADPSWQPSEHLLRARKFSISEATAGRSDGLTIPPILRWYLACQWLKPMRGFNELLDGRVSHWVAEMEQLATSKVSRSWTLRRTFNRAVMMWPERVGYAIFDRVREWRLARVYRRIEAEQGRAVAARRAQRNNLFDPMSAVRRLALAGLVSLKLGVIVALMANCNAVTLLMS